MVVNGKEQSDVELGLLICDMAELGMGFFQCQSLLKELQPRIPLVVLRLLGVSQSLG